MFIGRTFKSFILRLYKVPTIDTSQLAMMIL